MEIWKNDCFPTLNHFDMLKMISSGWRDYMISKELLFTL